MDRIMLPHDCFASKPKIHPANYKDARVADMDILWYVHYRFHDPSISKGPYAFGKKGKLVIKKGVTGYKDHSKRVEGIETLLEDEMDLLQLQGWNPIKKGCIPPARTEEQLLDEATLFNDALDEAFEKLKCGEGTKQDIRIALPHIKTAVYKLRFHRIPAREITIRHATLVLDRVGKDKGGWTASNFNHFRSYLLMLFKIIVPLANMSGNPVENIPKEIEPKKIRIVLSDEQRKAVNEKLFTQHYHYWRYVHLFFHSGGRTAELFRVTDLDVDLPNQRYKVMIRKGRQYEEVWKPIKTIALKFWLEIMKELREFRVKNKTPENVGALLFSKGLRPGLKPQDPQIISDLWREYVKVGMGINVDFYKLKHLNTTEVSTALSSKDAAAMNSHKSEEMVNRVYDVNAAERQLERIKNVDNAFA